MRVEQIYCTHCTYGTSALEQREGELADRVLGYSARAGSLDRNELRNDYRAIERFLYYYLPSDTPPEDKQRLDAAAAPRRLFFCPAMGKLQMVGQVAYRQYDTAGRLGSYFAHVLFAEHGQENWSAADCLRLWHAPWTEEESVAHPFKLPSLENLSQIWAGKSPPISDEAVLAFLHATSDTVGQAFSPSEVDSVGRASSPSTNEGLGRPPHDVVPSHALVDARWQTVPMEQRIDLLVNTLQGLLNLGPQRRESILLVAEPSIAALVFYGVARLLPKSLSGGLSFSTYEPNAERLPVTLAATTFFDPYTSDVRPDLYRRRGLVINTYQDRISESGPPPGDYARFIVDRLLEEGWPTVDRLLAAFDEAGARRSEDMELLSRTHRVSVQILSAVPPADDGWRKSEVSVRYLQREVQHQLASAPAGWPQLHKVLGTPNHLTVLELIAGDRVPAELRLPAQFLLKKFPPEKIADLIRSPLVAQAAKLEALLAYVAAHNHLPEDCQLLPTDGARLKPRPPSEALLTELVVRLPEPVLRRLSASIADGQRMAWFGAIADACAGHAAPPLKKAVVETISQFSDAELLEALAKYREPILRICPPPEPALARRLGRLLYELPKHPKSFEKWLAMLLEWKGSFANPNLAEQRLGEWNKIHSCLVALREAGESAAAAKKGVKNRLRSPPRAEYKPLAEALNRAMPRRPDEFQELHDVAARCLLTLPQFKERLVLASRHAGLSITFDDDRSGTAAAGDELFDSPGDEVARLHQRREQQARMQAMFHELEERLLIYADDSLGSEKLHALQQVGQLIVGRPDFLGPGRQMVEAYFSNGGAWSGPVLLSSGSKKTGRKRGKKSGKWKRQLTVMLAGAVCVALLVVVIGHFLAPHSPPTEVAKTSPAASSAPPVGSPAPVPAAGKARSNLAVPQPPASAPQAQADVHRPPAEPSKEDGAPLAKPKKQANDTDEVPSSPASSADRQTKPGKMEEGAEPSMPASSKASAPDAPGEKPAPPSAKPDEEKPAPTPPPAPKPEPSDSPSKSKQPAADPTVAKKDSPIIVDEYRTLPLPGRAFTTPVSLKTWTGDPGPITLTLKGLTWANNRLDREGRLSTKQDGDQFSIVLEKTAGDGAIHTLATLTKDKNELSFQWAEAEQSVTAARMQLRRCVVEVAGGDETTYISLMKPLERDELGMINGIAKLGLHELRGSEFEFSADDVLRLGRGAVQFTDTPSLAFGVKQSVTTAASLHHLPEPVRDSQAQVVLWRNEKNSLDAELRLVSDDTALPEDLSPISADDRKDLKTLRDNIPKLRRLAETLSRLNQRQITTMETQIRALAAVLGIKNPPRRAGAAPPAEAVKYAGDVKKQILDPAEELRDQLTVRVNAMDKFLKEQQAQLKMLTTRAVTITATIYRRVDAELYAPCLVLGDPKTIPEELPPGFGYEVDGQE